MDKFLGLLISSCRGVSADDFGGCLKLAAHPPSPIAWSPIVNLRGHVLKKGPAQSVILHALLGSELYHDRKTCRGLLTIHVKVVCSAVNQ
jgi:hypothetical protein